MPTLEGRVAIVTGAAQGIGQVYAETLAREGAAVALVDLKEEQAQANADAITRAGGQAIAIGCDVSDAGSVAAMCKTTAQSLGGIDILVNNAAIYEGYVSYALEEIPLDYWNRFLDVNASSVLICTQAVVPYMRERGGGRIVNQSSDGAQMVRNQYGLTKLLVQGLTVGFAGTLGPDKITVNAIAPGPIDTKATLDKYTESMQHLEAPLLIKRLGTPTDLAEFLAFVVSDKGEWITGQIFHINGGFWSRPA
jgi:NAD(P)-dependent dehydrogenase (short-subunit alcohol dehydrogenase family)